MIGTKYISLSLALLVAMCVVLSGCGSHDVTQSASVLPSGSPFQYDGRKASFVMLDSSTVPELKGGAVWLHGALYANVKNKGVMKLTIQGKALIVDKAGTVLTKRSARDLSTDGTRVYFTNYYHTYSLGDDGENKLVTNEYGNFLPIPGGKKAYVWMENQPFRELTLENGVETGEYQGFLKSYSQFKDPVHSLQDAAADSDALYLLGTYTDPKIWAEVSAIYSFAHDGTFLHKYGNSDTNSPDCIAEGRCLALSEDDVVAANHQTLFVFHKRDGTYMGRIALADMGIFLPVQQILPLEHNKLLIWSSGIQADEERIKKEMGQPYDEELIETGNHSISHFCILEL
jgi:hypothetical protein